MLVLAPVQENLQKLGLKFAESVGDCALDYRNLCDAGTRAFASHLQKTARKFAESVGACALE